MSIPCLNCEMLSDALIKVIDVHYENPFIEDLCHFESGHKCIYNGIESITIEDLLTGSCRCKGVDAK